MNNFKPVFYYAILFVIISYFFTLFNIHVYFLGTILSSIIPYVVLFVLFYLTAKKYKSLNDGYLSFGETLKYLFLMGAIGFILLTIVNIIFYNYISPDSATFLIQKALEGTENTYRAIGMPEDKIAMAMELVEGQSKSSYSIKYQLLGLFGMLIFTVILATLGALMFKKVKK